MIEQCTVGATGFFNTCGQFASCQPYQNQDIFTCVHDPVFTLNTGLIISYVITPVLVGVGILGGLGGIQFIYGKGGVLKGPLLEMILNYTQTQATQIAYCLMFGGVFLNTILQMFQKNPQDKARPIINYRIAIIFNLAVPLATNIGSQLAAFIPQLYALILQECFLFAVTPLLWKRAQQAKQNEIAQSNQTQETAQLNIQQEEETKINKHQVDTIDSFISSIRESFLPPSDDKDILFYQLKQESERVLPAMPILIILSSFGINQIFIQMRSRSPNKPSYVGIEDCTWLNDFVLIILVIANVLFGYFVYSYGVRQEQKFNKINFLPTERYFTPFSKFCIVYAGGFGAGFLSGFLGMGAGFVMVPVLLHCELTPRCASATSAFIYLMISFNNLITLLTSNHLGWQTIVLFTGLAIIGGSVITKIGYYFLDKYKIGYYVIMIVFSLAISNILAFVYYGFVTAKRFGLDILTATHKNC